MEVSDQLHVSSRFTSLERAPCTHWRGESVSPRAGPDTQEKREISCICRESNRTVSRRCTDWDELRITCLMEQYQSTSFNCLCFDGRIRTEHKMVPEGRLFTKWRPPNILYLRRAIRPNSGLSGLTVLRVGEAGGNEIVVWGDRTFQHHSDAELQNEKKHLICRPTSWRSWDAVHCGSDDI
jgi:hypothetical protein